MCDNARSRVTARAITLKRTCDNASSSVATPTRPLFEAATRLSIEIDQAAYDCLYLALAVEKRCQFVTADERLLRKLHQGRQQTLRGRAISLFEAEKL